MQESDQSLAAILTPEQVALLREALPRQHPPRGDAAAWKRG
jgi:hypothetical protein